MKLRYFFFSYSRDDNTAYLKRFYRDLDEAVRGIVGSKDVSFFDQSKNEPGDHWEANLEAALSSARVFVAVATASYGMKEYCGKEWAAFDHRLNRYSQDEGLRQVPPLIIPVLWIPPNERIAPFPKQIQERHYHLGDPKEDPNVKGIEYLTRLKGTYKTKYVDFVNGLAKRIADLAAVHGSFDKYSDVPKLADVESSFHEKGSGALSPASGALVIGGPRHVHFVYAAAAPSEIRRNTERQDATAYGDNGGAEWQPFFPETHTIGALAPRVAGSDEINMIPHELPLTQDLHQKVRQCESNRHLVVVVLDAWTTTLQWYRKALKLLDQQNYMNCGVLIP